MKRPLCLILTICVFVTLLGGCGLSDSVLRLNENTEELYGPDVQELEVLATQPPLYRDAEPPMLWARDQLEDHARDAYDRVSAAVAARREEPLAVDADPEEMQLVLTAIRMDHPEYFWFDGKASFVTSTLAGVVLRTECTFTYTMNLEEIRQAHQKIRQYTAACLSALELSGAASDYDKILGVYRYIIDNTDYLITQTDQSILSVMGIPCTLAMGLDENGEPHGWNVVSCEGQWYQMDVTWGDPVDDQGLPGQEIRYTYCLVTDEEIYRDHTLTCEIPVPVCTATTCNYFVREGLQMDAWNLPAYESGMARALGQGEIWYAVRFSTQDAYDMAVSALFQEEEIWGILRRIGVPEDYTHVVYTCRDREIAVKLEPEEYAS